MVWKFYSYKFTNRMLELLLIDDTGKFEYTNIEKSHVAAPGIPASLCALLGAYINDINGTNRQDRLDASNFASLICREWVGIDNYDSVLSILEGDCSRWIIAGRNRMPIGSLTPEMDQLIVIARGVEKKSGRHWRI